MGLSKRLRRRADKTIDGWVRRAVHRIEARSIANRATDSDRALCGMPPPLDEVLRLGSLSVGLSGYLEISNRMHWDVLVETRSGVPRLLTELRQAWRIAELAESLTRTGRASNIHVSERECMHYAWHSDASRIDDEAMYAAYRRLKVFFLEPPSAAEEHP